MSKKYFPRARWTAFALLLLTLFAGAYQTAWAKGKPIEKGKPVVEQESTPLPEGCYVFEGFVFCGDNGLVPTFTPTPEPTVEAQVVPDALCTTRYVFGKIPIEDPNYPDELFVVAVEFENNDTQSCIMDVKVAGNLLSAVHTYYSDAINCVPVDQDPITVQCKGILLVGAKNPRIDFNTHRDRMEQLGGVASFDFYVADRPGIRGVFWARAILLPSVQTPQ